MSYFNVGPKIVIAFYVLDTCTLIPFLINNAQIIRYIRNGMNNVFVTIKLDHILS